MGTIGGGREWPAVALPSPPGWTPRRWLR